MNPEITVRPAGIDVSFLLAGNPKARVGEARKPVPDSHSVARVEDTANEAAESARQDSLAFLHRLVMG